MTSYKRDKELRRQKFQEDKDTLRYHLKRLIQLAELGLYGLLLAVILLVGIFICLITR